MIVFSVGVGVNHEAITAEHRQQIIIQNVLVGSTWRCSKSSCIHQIHQRIHQLSAKRLCPTSCDWDERKFCHNLLRNCQQHDVLSASSWAASVSSVKWDYLVKMKIDGSHHTQLRSTYTNLLDFFFKLLNKLILMCFVWVWIVEGRGCLLINFYLACWFQRKQQLI